MDGRTAPQSGNLPDMLPSFVGHGDDLARIDAALQTSRLVTLVGVAGVGKTRTAVEAGDRVRERFADGVWLIPLSQVRDGALVAHTVALETHARDQTARPVLELLIEHLANQECLLILDTCEHLLADCGALASALLEACPSVRIIATSRQPLEGPGQTLIEIEPLPVSPDLDDPGGDAIALFVRRAREAAGFELTRENADAVAALCRRLDGLPLALELVAAQLRERTIEELAERPDVRADLPPKGDHTFIAPHGGLWTAIGWSHELCTPAERLLWARASVFAGGFSHGAAHEVCSGDPIPDVGETLASLVNKSILVWSGDRYRLLDPMREYGAFWLRELGEQRQTRIRHRDRYLAMARTAFPQWTGAEQARWYRNLAADYAEVRLAMETCLAEPGPAAVEFAGALWFFWFSCEYEREGRAYLERALAHDTSPGPMRVRAAWALGTVMTAQGDMDGIERCIRECRSAAPDTDAMRAADYIEGTDWAMSGRPDLALERLVSLAGSDWEPGVQEAVWMLARAALAFARLAMGDYAEAGRIAEDMRADGQRRGELKFQSWGYYIQSLIDFSSADHAAAERNAAIAFEGSRELGDSSNMALAVEAQALALAAQNDHEQAAHLLGVSHRLWHPNGGRDRFTTPELASARAACEDELAKALGQEAWDQHFFSGLHAPLP
ncbi:hypothetical protein J4573_36785 [Actinomadura barringtoniae]|uniref:LuxR family transcriptional regulator n=1 Tax=Actinomadura barringtoniae TaxID=1427535 RepID=A0A939PH04_9ACTN|nr:hypothetical protein [Actinomadura barringtoniae]MBO2452697.1 hypothetical protein [Actinomadura barringtoniae]